MVDKTKLNEEILGLMDRHQDLTDTFSNTKTVDCRSMFWSLDEERDILHTNKTKNNFYPSSRERRIVGTTAIIVNLTDLILLIDKEKTYVLTTNKEVNMKIKPIDGNLFCKICGEYLGRVYEGLLYRKIETIIDGNEIVCNRCGYGNVTYFNYR